MPIRINLLAEQQAAEEARRKDPVKRALWAGGALVGIMLLWAGLLQLQVNAGRAAFADIEDRLKKAEDEANIYRNIQAQAGDLERRTAALERYSTNRVLWASALNALQSAAVDSIRLMNVSSSQRYTTNAANKFHTAEFDVEFPPAPPGWKFWAKAPAATPILTLASNKFATFTNALPFTTNHIAYKTKLDVVSTNIEKSTVRVKAEFTIPALATEDISFTISGRDYGPPPGAKIAAYAKGVAATPFFKERLPKEGDPVRFTDRPPNPETDPLDFLTPNGLFVRFTARVDFAERILTND